jgi:hypothetical protein
MSFLLKIFAARGLVLLALAAPVWPATAQQQHIQFSKPVDPGTVSKPSQLVPSPGRQISAGAFAAPVPLLGTPSVSFDRLPGGPMPNAMSAADSAQLQKLMDIRKNWSLATPEEIFGLQTPESILGVGKSHDDAKLSVTERYLKRQDQLALRASTNAMRGLGASWRDDSRNDSVNGSTRPGDAMGRYAPWFGDSAPGGERGPNNLFGKPNPNAAVDASRRSDSIWSSPFNQPDPLPKQTPEQLAGMERFRAFMDPSVEKPADSKFLVQPAAAADPNMQELPYFNPAGQSYTPVQSGITKPTGLAPLSGITGPRPLMQKKAAPLAQPPPWMSTPNSAQEAPLPQRQF